MFALLEDIDITRVADDTGSAGTEVVSTYVDMQGWDGAVFFGTIATANAGNFGYVRQSTSSDGSTGVSHLSGTRSIAASDGQVARICVHEPRATLGRYLAAAFIRAGTNTALGEIYCVRYRTKKGPAALGIGKIVQGPAGTTSGTGA
jgi:hypothetical protein